MENCPGTWRERMNLETDDVLLVCDVCGDMATIHKGKWIDLGNPKKQA